MSTRTTIVRFLTAPVADCMAAMDVLVAGNPWRSLPLALAAMVISWFVYVPIHELAHAYGCIITGGQVSRLEIDPMYGASWLKEFFPFVHVGSQYAGQLTGFDTGGSDLVYLATDFAPFLLTILVGVPLLRRAPRCRRPEAAALVFGAAFPIAFAPLVSLPGDYYEMGSIIVSRLFAAVAGVPLDRWRSDDVFLLVETLRSSGWHAADALAIGAAAALGGLLAIATYLAGAVVATIFETAPGADRISARDTSA